MARHLFSAGSGHFGSAVGVLGEGRLAARIAAAARLASLASEHAPRNPFSAKRARRIGTTCKKESDGLGPRQVVALAREMQPYLVSNPQIEGLIRSLDPQNARFTDPVVAKRVLEAWVLMNNATTGLACKPGLRRSPGPLRNREEPPMANVATTETFPKRAFTHADVEAERAARLQIPGVISSTITNAAADWLLTTIFPGPDSGASAPGPAAPAPPAMQGPAAPPHPVPPATPSAPAPRNAEAVFRRKVPGFMRSLMADFELRDFHAAGVFGNIGHECAGFTILHEIGQPEGKGGYGWAQWTGPRRVAFLKWCDDHGLRFTDDEANYGFLKHELDTSQSDAIAALLKTATLDGAVQAFERNFERAGVPNFPSRNHWAAIALDAFNAANA